MYEIFKKMRGGKKYSKLIYKIFVLLLFSVKIISSEKYTYKITNSDEEFLDIKNKIKKARYPEDNPIRLFGSKKDRESSVFIDIDEKKIIIEMKPHKKDELLKKNEYREYLEKWAGKVSDFNSENRSIKLFKGNLSFVEPKYNFLISDKLKEFYKFIKEIIKNPKYSPFWLILQKYETNIKNIIKKKEKEIFNNAESSIFDGFEKEGNNYKIMLKKPSSIRDEFKDLYFKKRYKLKIAVPDKYKLRPQYENFSTFEVILSYKQLTKKELEEALKDYFLKKYNIKLTSITIRDKNNEYISIFSTNKHLPDGQYYFYSSDLHMNEDKKSQLLEYTKIVNNIENEINKKVKIPTEKLKKFLENLDNNNKLKEEIDDYLLRDMYNKIINLRGETKKLILENEFERIKKIINDEIGKMVSDINKANRSNIKKILDKHGISYKIKKCGDKHIGSFNSDAGNFIEKVVRKNIKCEVTSKEINDYRNTFSNTIKETNKKIVDKISELIYKIKIKFEGLDNINCSDKKYCVEQLKDIPEEYYHDITYSNYFNVIKDTLNQYFAYNPFSTKNGNEDKTINFEVIKPGTELTTSLKYENYNKFDNLIKEYCKESYNYKVNEEIKSKNIKKQNMETNKTEKKQTVDNKTDKKDKEKDKEKDKTEKKPKYVDEKKYKKTCCQPCCKTSCKQR